MSQQRQFQMVGVGVGVGVGGNNAGGGQTQFIDTTFTKIFVGGLAWETQRDTMRRYFEQFGEIQEAVVITDKNTGRSKGYGFVTFKDPDSALRACQDPSPVIDGRRANCNLASLGANRNHPSTIPHQHGMGRFRPGSGSGSVAAPPTFQGSSSAYFHQPTHYTFPYSAYGYSGYSQDNIYPMNYYNVYGGQQVSGYYTAASASGAPGIYHPSYYPFYAQYAQSGQTQGVRIQYPPMVQYPYLPQHYGTPAILTVPTSVSPVAVSTGVTVVPIEGAQVTTGSSITIKDPGGTTTKQSSSA